MTQDELNPLIIRVFIKEYKYQNMKRNGQTNPVKFFECRCSNKECKNTFKVQRSKIKRSTGFCVSCANKGPPHLVTFKKVVKSSKFYGFKSTLTYSEYLALCAEPNCHYCDTPLNRRAHSGQGKSAGPYMIDRIDNELGYIASNCVPCCWPCNDLKGARFTYEEFKTLRSFIKTTFGR